MDRCIFYFAAVLYVSLYTRVAADPTWCALYINTYCTHKTFSDLCPIKCAGRSNEGVWGTWTSWEACSKRCDGTTKRYRTCTHFGTTNGCKAESGGYQKTAQTETKSCDEPGADCRTPVNGNWAYWSLWSQCSVTCGNGQRFRTRACSNPAPLYGGKSCTRMDGTENQKDETHNEVCIRDPCPIDGKFTDWSSWTECSATCGEGQRYRKRCCSNPAPAHGGKHCEGGSIISKPCQTAPCPVNGNWEQWTQWTACDVTCGYVGVRKRHRNCTDPPASFGGKICPGLGMETAVCGRRGCPVDGGFSDYSDWSLCSDDCNGIQYRARSCNSPAAVNGGQSCSGETGELRPCKANPDNCPIAPSVETVLVTGPTSPTDDYKAFDLPLMHGEYTVEGEITIADLSAAVVGNIFTIETSDTYEKGKAGPALDLVQNINSDFVLTFYTNINNQVVSYTTTTPLTTTAIPFKIDQYLENGEYQRRITVNSTIDDKAPNPMPIETRQAHVYVANGTAAQGVSISNLKYISGKNKMCPSKADVLYIIDTSTNVLAKLTETMAFMTQMARAFPLTAAPTSKGSVMVFNHVAELKIRLKDAATAAPFFAAMAVLGPVTAAGDSSLAMIDLALTMARDEVFLPELGDQVDVPNLVIMFLESPQSAQAPNSPTPEAIANEMRVNGIKIFIVAVDNNISDAALKAISGGDYNYIRAVSWAEIENEEFIGRALEMACRVLNAGTTITFPSS